MPKLELKIPMLNLGKAVSTKPKEKTKKDDLAKKSPATMVDSWKPPTHDERMANAAKDAMVDARRRWVMGEMSTAKHTEVMKRAKSSLKGK